MTMRARPTSAFEFPLPNHRCFSFFRPLASEKNIGVLYLLRRHSCVTARSSMVLVAVAATYLRCSQNVYKSRHVAPSPRADQNHVVTESPESGHGSDGCPGRPGRSARRGRSRRAVRQERRRRHVPKLPLLQSMGILRLHRRLLRQWLSEPVQRLRPQPRPHAAPSPAPRPPAPPAGPGVASIVSRDLFEQLLLHRNDVGCLARGFYTYDAFITAAAAFPDFGTKGDDETRKREVAAFLGQTSHETTGGWDDAPNGTYSWGYCYKEEIGATADYCVPSAEWPCAPGKKYYGRGPIQLSYNYNYGPAGQAIGEDLLNNPELVAEDPVVSFKTALWFGMTPQAPKPSCHAVATGQWTPSDADIAAGYGVITNIINGGEECGRGPDKRVENRIGFYEHFCNMFGVSYGPNLDCYAQRPFNSGLAAQ